MLTKEQVIQLNDELRINPTPGRLFMTRGVASSEWVYEIVGTVSRFTDFHPGNDPYGEHDFGMFVVQGLKCFFKIDYYADDSLTMGTEADDEKAIRILTVMLAEEY